MKKIQLLFLGTALIMLINCDDDSTTVTLDDSSNGSVDVSVLASKFYNSPNVTVTVGINDITIRSTNEPDHESMYYPTSHPLYKTYTEIDNPDFKQNPNFIEAQNYVFTLPRYPSEATSKESTGFGAIGVAVNSVVFFNQQAAPGDDILDELNTFDQYEGHPQNEGQYHYHIEPVWITQLKGSEAFLGFLLDGFPVYGPIENGKALTDTELDEYYGHTSATADFPDGIYHYHFSSELMWVNGGQYYGSTGTVTN